MGDDIAARYARVLGRGGLDQAACYTVIQPVTKLFGVEEVARRLGADPATLRRGVPEEHAFDPDECHYRIGQIGSAIVMIEDNGFQGSRPEVLRWLSDGARVHSAFWNVNAVNDLSYAVYGRVQTRWSIDFPDECHGSDPTAFDGDLDELVAMASTDDDGGYAGYWQAGMMAFIERRTGVVLAEEWLDDEAFPAVALTRQVGRTGGSAPAVYNAANEICVERLLAGRLPFLAIVDTVAQVVAELGGSAVGSIEEIRSADAWARTRVRELTATH